MDRRELLKSGGAAVAAALAGGLVARQVDGEAQTGDVPADVAQAAIDHAQAIVTLLTPYVTSPTTTTTTTTLPPETTTTVPETTTTTVPPTTTTTLPPGLPTTIGTLTLAGGTYHLTGDTVVTGTFTLRPDVVLKLNGYTLAVRGAGRLDWQGTPRLGWSYGPAAYVAGDTCVVAPTDTVTFDRAFTYTGETLLAHPVLGTLPEVCNLTRDVVVLGPGDVHVMNDQPAAHVVRYVRLEFLGVTGVLGRYPLHFHMCGPNTAGTVVEGVVSVQGQNHAFVPHASDGILFRDCVAYDTLDDPFWWDRGTTTNDLTYDHCLALVVKPPPGDPGYRLTGFKLGGGISRLTGGVDGGTGLVIRDCSAVAVNGQSLSAGYHWPENDEGLWTFIDNVAHNCRWAGISTWQNTPRTHTVQGFTAYSCGHAGVEHGAYVNPYDYRHVTTVDCPAGVLLHAEGRDPGLRFQHVHMGTGTPLVLAKPTLNGTPAVFTGVNYGPADVQLSYDPATITFPAALTDRVIFS